MKTALLVHSGGFTGRQWRKLGELLAPTHDVLAPDLIGYGANPWPAGEPFHFRQDVERLAGLLRGRRADVVGHSYGGFLALQLALAHPELVDRIAVYDPVAFNVLTAEQRATRLLPAPRALRAGRGRRRRGVARRVRRLVERPRRVGQLPAPTTQAAFRAVGWKLSQEVAVADGGSRERLRADHRADDASSAAGSRPRPTPDRGATRRGDAAAHGSRCSRTSATWVRSPRGPGEPGDRRRATVNPRPRGRRRRYHRGDDPRVPDVRQPVRRHRLCGGPAVAVSLRHRDDAAPPEPKQAGLLACPHCGAGSRRRRRRCEYCNAELLLKACPRCLSRVFVGHKHCPECGAELDVAAAAPSARSCPARAATTRCARGWSATS